MSEKGLAYLVQHFESLDISVLCGVELVDD